MGRGLMSTHIDITDRSVTAAQVDAIERRIRAAAVERVRATQPVQRAWDAGLKVRWTPGETRAATKPNHVGKILTALKQHTLAALVAALTAAYLASYGDGGDDSTRLAALTDEAPQWSANLLSYLASDAAPEPLDVAVDTASTCEVAGHAASTLDDIESTGATTYSIECQDGACAECEADEGDHPIDSPSPIPHHPSCRCVIVESENE